MSGEVNWKTKYTELKAKFMESVDMAFRLGFEQGGQQAQQDQAMQQQQQEHELDQAALQGVNQPAGGGGPMDSNNTPGGPEQGFTDQEGPGASQAAGPGQGIQPMKDSEHPDGSELDQHISTLETMLSKGELLDVTALKETLNGIKALQKSQKELLELRKSAAAIPEIAKAMHKPKFKISVQASHNMNSTAKAAVTMQHKIVEDVLKKWEVEEKNANKDILAQLGIDGLKKD